MALKKKKLPPQVKQAGIPAIMPKPAISPSMPAPVKRPISPLMPVAKKAGMPLAQKGPISSLDKAKATAKVGPRGPISSLNKAAQPQTQRGPISNLDTVAPPPQTGSRRRAIRGLAGATQGSAVYRERNQDAAANVARVIAQGGPLMTLAQTEGLQQANRRGLLSSSMAVGAAQDSVYRAATPIGLQNAAQNAARNMSRQEFEQAAAQQATDINSQEFMQGRALRSGERIAFAQIESTEGMARAQRELDKFLQRTDIAAEEKQQIRDIASREGMAKADRVLERLLQRKQLGSAERMLGRQIGSQERMQRRDIGADRASQIRAARADRLAQKRDIAARRGEARLDRGLQRELASWNLDAAEKEQAASQLTTYQNIYEAQINAINDNRNLTPEARAKQLESLQFRREKYIKVLRGLYNVRIDW